MQKVLQAMDIQPAARYVSKYVYSIKTKLSYLFVFSHIRPVNQTTVRDLALCHKKSLDTHPVDLHIAKATTLVHSVIKGLGGNSSTYTHSQL
jgi:hypothetical protein